MPSYKYKSHKFEYYSDDGDIYIRYQREYLDPDGQPLTPITETFNSAKISDPAKIDPFGKQPRKVLAYVSNQFVQREYSKMSAFLPYAPGDPRLKRHIKEVLDHPRVVCGDYHGEVYEKD